MKRLPILAIVTFSILSLAQTKPAVTLNSEITTTVTALESEYRRPIPATATTIQSESVITARKVKEKQLFAAIIAASPVPVEFIVNNVSANSSPDAKYLITGHIDWKTATAYSVRDKESLKESANPQLHQTKAQITEYKAIVDKYADDKKPQQIVSILSSNPDVETWSKGEKHKLTITVDSVSMETSNYEMRVNDYSATYVGLTVKGRDSTATPDIAPRLEK